MSELRLARKADALAIHALLRAARHEIGLNWKGNDDWHVKWIEDHCKRRTVWVVESDKEIAGAMLMRGNEIIYSVVSGRHRRRGIGRALLCTDKGWGTLTGQARRANTPILALLNAEGFRLDRTLQATNADWDVYIWVRYSANDEGGRHRHLPRDG